jgi:hypothetical protein
LALLLLNGHFETERSVKVLGEAEKMSIIDHSEESILREIQGEALWNLEAGRLHSLDVTVDKSSKKLARIAVSGDDEYANDWKTEVKGVVKLMVVFEQV